MGSSSAVLASEVAAIGTLFFLAVVLVGVVLLLVGYVVSLHDAERAARKDEFTASVLGPAHRLCLELDAPCHGGLPRWAFANVDPSPSQVESFAVETAPLVELVRHRMLELASTHNDSAVRSAATLVAVRSNSCFVAALSALDGVVLSFSGDSEPSDVDKGVNAHKRLCDSVDVLEGLIVKSGSVARLTHGAMPGR